MSAHSAGFEARIGGDGVLTPDSPPLIEVPPGVVAGFGTGKRPRVRVTVGGHTYRSTVAVYGDRFYLPLARANREAAGVELGQRVTVVLEADLEPRTVDPGPELLAAFAAEPALGDRFAALAFTRAKELNDSIATAKRPATRAARLTRALEQLRAGTGTGAAAKGLD